MLTRNQFIQATMGAMAATFAGCGDSAGTGGAGGTGSTSGNTSGNTSSSKSSSVQSGSSSKATSGSGSTGTGQPLTCDSPATSIGANHPVGTEHVMTVSMADVTAGVDKIYDIMGNSIHTHAVTLTAADFAALKSAGSIMVTSATTSFHSHPITVTCGS